MNDVTDCEKAKECTNRASTYQRSKGAILQSQMCFNLRKAWNPRHDAKAKEEEESMEKSLL